MGVPLYVLIENEGSGICNSISQTTSNLCFGTISWVIMALLEWYSVNQANIFEVKIFTLIHCKTLPTAVAYPGAFKKGFQVST